MMGNPTQQLGNFKTVVLPQRAVKVVKAGWYGPHHKPVAVDEKFSMPADDAAGAVARGLAVYVK
jgi:hypothetical protein